MQYQVFLQNQAEQRFIASVVGIPNLSVEGNTEAEAIAKAKQALQEYLAKGELVTIHLDSPLNGQESDPWIKHMGIFADDPSFEDFVAEVTTYRQQVDTLAGEG